MSFCTSCGSKCKDDARFCHACGTEVHRQAGTAVPATAPATAAPAAPIRPPPAAEPVDITTALKYGEWSMWALGASLLAVMRHVTEIVDLTPVAFFVVMATIGAYGGLIYLLVIRIGIKQRKHGVVLGTAIAFTVISAVSLLVWGVPIEPIDWALQVLGAIQIVLTFMVYAKLKPESSLTHAN
jgi:hypothetical protein